MTAKEIIQNLPANFKIAKAWKTWKKSNKARAFILKRVEEMLAAGIEITAETKVGMGEYLKGSEESAMRRMERERTEDAKILHLLDFACRKMLECGWELEHKSGCSMYFIKNSCRFRISDHCVPATGERDYNATNGGFSWAGSDEQIIITARLSEESLVAEIETL